MLGLEGCADSDPALQRDEHREVDGAALAEHPNLKTGPVKSYLGECYKYKYSPIYFLKG